MKTHPPHGFSSRAMRIADAPSVADLLNRETLKYGGEPSVNAAEYANELLEPGFSLEDDTRVVVTADDAIAGLAEVYVTAPWVRPFVWVHSDPEFGGRGIARWLLTWAEARARERVVEAPPEARITLGASALESNQAAKALLEGLGFHPVRTFYRMRISMVEPPALPLWPDGISPRSMIPDADDLAVYLTADEAFEDHWGHVKSPQEEGFARWQHHLRNDPAFDPSLEIIAQAETEIAGVAICSVTEEGGSEIGWIHQLAVKRPWRKQGLGRALLLQAFANFYGRGVTEVGLGVDADSLTGATRLYESVGMKVRHRNVAFEKELRSGVSFART